MSVPVIIIIGGPRPGGRTVETENRLEFPSPAAAISYLERFVELEDQSPEGESNS